MRENFDTVEEFWDGNVLEQAHECAGNASLNAYRSAFAAYLGVPEDSVHLTPNGRQGIEWLLMALERKPKSTVLVPAFNCSVVQQAITKAGCKAKCYDFSPKPGLFEWKKVIEAIDKTVGSIIITHYFGVPMDFRLIIDYCRSKNILIIEDCAHTLGAKIGGINAGTLGDAAIFSFNYDKPISLAWGGLIVVNNKGVSNLDQIQDFRIPTPAEEMTLLGQFLEGMQYRRRMIPFQHRIAFEALRKLRIVGTRLFHSPPDISMGAVQAELGIWCLCHYTTILEQRNKNASTLATQIKHSTWPVGRDVQPVWLKQKVRLRNRKQLKRVSNALQRQGYRAGNFNWPLLISGHRPDFYPHSEEVASLWMDMPVHQNLQSNDLEKMISILNQED